MVDVKLQNSNAEFYDEIYRKNPNKWSSVDRDYLAFKILSHYVHEPKRMLDYGCGNGHTLAFFQNQWPNTEYFGVDISKVALQIAEDKVPGGLFFNKLPQGAWEVITIMGVAEHFKDVPEELFHLSAHLPSKGLIYLEVPNCLAYSVDKTEGFRKTHQGADQDEWHWKHQTWEKAIEEAGLEIVQRYKGGHATFEFIWVLRDAS